MIEHLNILFHVAKRAKNNVKYHQTSRLSSFKEYENNMSKGTVNIGIIGDYDSSRISHTATDAAIEHAARYLSIKVTTSWLPTPSFLIEKEQRTLERYDAIWASPGSPYQSMEGAIKAIQIAREAGRPFIGT
jgi:CTP synthase (UTP-ammonia lyase)